MTDWLEHRGINVPFATPSGQAGLYLKSDLLLLADGAPHASSSNPVVSDDSSKGFGVSALWLNTATQTLWMCTDNTVGAAQWRSLFSRSGNALVLTPVAGVGGTDLRGIAHGKNCTASGLYSHAGGYRSTASDYCAHAEGVYSGATASCAHAEGFHSAATGQYSHAEGAGSYASGAISHAEGRGATASSYCSHAEGSSCSATNYYSHAEGVNTSATAGGAHAEGNSTVASGSYSHAGGRLSKAKLWAQWARASGGHIGQVGTAQATITHLFTSTSTTTAKELTLDGGTPSGANRFVIRDGQTLSCFINVVGRQVNADSSLQASFLRQACICREGSSTQLVGTQTLNDIKPTGWDVTITADDTNESLKITVTGSSNTVRWAATVFATETADAAI